MDFGDIPEITLGGSVDDHRVQEPHVDTASEVEGGEEGREGGDSNRSSMNLWRKSGGSEQEHEHTYEQEREEAEQRGESSQGQARGGEGEEEQPEVYRGNTVEDEEIAEITMSDREVMGAYRDLTSIPEYIAQRYGNLATRLDLSHNLLTNLVNLDKFTQLKELVLDNNEISENITFPTMPTLHSLSLNKCNVRELDRFLTMLRERLPNLTFLSLIGNEACPNEFMGGKSEEDYNRYRLRVLHILPHLKFLDSRAVTPAEVAEAKRVGEFVKVVKVSERDLELQAAKRASEPQEKALFSPLPKEARSPDAHKGTIGTCKYVYYGRHSEGNRFIRNNDL